MKIDFPKSKEWAKKNTPLEKMHKLSEELGIDLWIKRDDQTGLEWSGNKIRKLEYIVPEAIDNGVTCLITCGGIQSNHCRATAALAAKLGLRAVLFLRGDEPKKVESNFLLMKVLGAETFFLNHEQYYEDMSEYIRLIDGQIRSQGGKTLFIPEGATCVQGCFGYIDTFQEIEKAWEEMNPNKPLDTIFVANGSGGTQAGLVLGKLLSNSETNIAGINVCYDKSESFRRVKKVIWDFIQQKKLGLSFMAEDLVIIDGYLGKGYGIASEDDFEIIKKIARSEGIILDPVYTGKAFRGMLSEIKKNKERFGSSIVFVHTGGCFGNFTEKQEWANHLA
ncbi:MAG: D-cysteine desulfhydrase family protein [Oligoflexia bacterium]|nr:D-cysteine desulfhydrase family protein [Oligoflexia bacterium]